jgi:hypothetical protein
MLFYNENEWEGVMLGESYARRELGIGFSGFTASWQDPTPWPSAP